MNATAATIAVTMKMRASMPSRWSCPAARRSSRQRWSSRVASTSVTIIEAMRPKKATVMPAKTLSVR